MKANKITLDWIMRLNLYILPLFLLFLSAKSFKDNNFISEKQYSYTYDYALSNPDYYLDNILLSNNLFRNRTSSGSGAPRIINSWGQLMYEDLYPYQISNHFFDDDFYYLYHIPFYNDFLNSLFTDTFYFYLILTSDERYVFIPDFDLKIDTNIYYSFDSQVVWDIELGYILTCDYDKSSIFDTLTYNSVFDYSISFYDFYIYGVDFYSNISDDLDTLFNFNQGLNNYYHLIDLFNTENVSFIDFELDYPNFNVEFNNIMKPILDLPFAKQFYQWFENNVLQERNYIIENVFAWIFYLVFVEFAILIKNVLIFLFYWANKLMERGLNIND